MNERLASTNWAFVHIKQGSKAPIGESWQNKPFAYSELTPIGQEFEHEITINKKGDKRLIKTPVGAHGVLLGPVSGGLIALDHDGASVDDWLAERGIELPKTRTVSAGRKGHYQSFYRVPEHLWDCVDNKIIYTGATKQEYGKEVKEQIDLRWVGRQSLVEGTHPESGNQYQIIEWVDEIPELPEELLKLMLKDYDEADEREHFQREKEAKQSNHQWGDPEWAREYIKAINLNNSDWYEWRNIMLALHDAGIDESEARAISATSHKHTDKGFDDVWKHIKGVPGYGVPYLGRLAKKNGWVSPFNKKKAKSQSQSPARYADPVDGTEEENDEQKFERMIGELLLAESLYKNKPARKFFEFEEIAAKYKRSYRSVEKIFRLYNSKVERAELISMADIRATVKELKEDEYIVANLLPRQTTVCFYAEAGLGKTLFVYDLIHHVHINRPFLDKPIIYQPKTLIIQLDEPDRVMRNRFREKGMLKHDNIYVINKWNFSQMDYLEDLIKEHGFELILIDNLTAAMRGADVEEKDPDYGSPLFDLRDLCVSYNATCIIIHHANKKGELRGSTAIEANVSEVWRLRKYNKEIDPPNAKIGKDERIFHVTKHRDDTGQEILVKLIDNHLSYLFAGDMDKFKTNGGPNAPTTLIERVKAWFKSNPDQAVTYADLSLTELFMQEKKATLRQTTHRLHGQGFLQVTDYRQTEGGGPRQPVYRYARLLQSPQKVVTASQRTDQTHTGQGIDVVTDHCDNAVTTQVSNSLSQRSDYHYDAVTTDATHTCNSVVTASCHSVQPHTEQGFEDDAVTLLQDLDEIAETIVDLNDRVNDHRNDAAQSDTPVQRPINPYTGPQIGDRVRFVSDAVTNAQLLRMRRLGQEPPWGSEGFVIDVEFGNNGYWCLVESSDIRDNTLPLNIQETYTGRFTVTPDCLLVIT